MIEILSAYLSVGWFVTSVASAYLIATKGPGEAYEAGDFLRIIPLWPVLVIVAIYLLIATAVAWGIDD